MFKKLINIALKNPINIFLIDAFGAGISVVLLGIILPLFHTFLGIPKPVLYFLALIPVFFIIYDLLSYFLIKENIVFWLKGIAFLNISYCFISVFCAFIHYKTITFWGCIYIFIEVLIILLLAIFQLNVSNKIITKID